jgi:hypothetical protein
MEDGGLPWVVNRTLALNLLQRDDDSRCFFADHGVEILECSVLFILSVR